MVQWKRETAGRDDIGWFSARDKLQDVITLNGSVEQTDCRM